MLRKLISYEVQNLWRFFSLVYAVLLLLTGLIKLGLLNLPGFLYGQMIFIILFLTIGALANRFWQSIYGRESSFFLTLPASSTQLILAKIISSVLWLLASSLMIGVTFILQNNEIGKLISNQLPYMFYIALPSIIIMGLVVLVSLYTAISLAHLPIIQKNHMGWTILFFIILMSLLPVMQKTTGSLITHKINISVNDIVIDKTGSLNPLPNSFMISLNSVVWGIVFCITNFLCLRYLLKRKLIAY